MATWIWGPQTNTRPVTKRKATFPELPPQPTMDHVKLLRAELVVLQTQYDLVVRELNEMKVKVARLEVQQTTSIGDTPNAGRAPCPPSYPVHSHYHMLEVQQQFYAKRRRRLEHEFQASSSHHRF